MFNTSNKITTNKANLLEVGFFSELSEFPHDLPMVSNQPKYSWMETVAVKMDRNKRHYLDAHPRMFS